MTAPTAALLRNEMRALGPLWGGCTAAVALGWFDGPSVPLLGLAPVLALVLGSIALGAHAFGHEFTHRTLVSLLAQPVARRRVLLVKFLVAALLVATLALVGAYALAGYRGLFAGLHREFLLISVSALFIAPAFTLLSRSSLAGVVFTVALPGGVILALDGIGSWRFGSTNAQAIDAFTRSAMTPVMSILAAAAAVASIVLFDRLEVLELGGRQLTLWPARSRRTRAHLAGRHPFVLLVAKEVRIHQLALAIAGLFVAGLVLVAALRSGEHVSPFLSPLTVLYMMSMPLLIGALAVAEERQYGTIAGQLLTPMPSWQSWAVKVTVAVSLSLLLGLALPNSLALTGLIARGDLPTSSLAAVLMTLLAAFTLWISSMATSGIRAVLVAVPTLVGTLLFVQWTGMAMDRAAVRGLIPTFPPGAFRAAGMPRFGVEYALAALVMIVLCALAYSNYRVEAPRPRRIAEQCGLLAAALALLVVASTILSV